MQGVLCLVVPMQHHETRALSQVRLLHGSCVVATGALHAVARRDCQVFQGFVCMLVRPYGDLSLVALVLGFFKVLACCSVPVVVAVQCRLRVVDS